MRVRALRARRLRSGTGTESVTDYDGLVQYGPDRIEPERMSDIASRRLALMEGDAKIIREDAEANAVRPGGMQFRAERSSDAWWRGA